MAQIMVPNECANCDEHKPPQITTSKLFQVDSTLYTDKSVMECEVPQLSVCCKDNDCQHVKDICVDKGEPLEEEKGLIEIHTDNFTGPHVSKPSNGYETTDTIGNLDYEFHIPDGLTSPAHVDFSDLTVDRCEAKEESKIVSPLLSETECHSPGKVKENGPNSQENAFRNSNNPFLVGEIQNSAQDGSTIDDLHETPLKNTEEHSSIPFGMEVQNAIVQVSDEEILPKTIADHKKENFNPFESHQLREDEEPADIPKRRSTNNPFDDCEVENTNMDKNWESIDQQSELGNKIADTSNPFSVNDIHKGNSYNPFIDSETEKTVIEGAPKNVSFTDQGGTGSGETSFSAVSGRITYSGPIPFSGSISLRSDSSTTSTRSFAFPVLQSEWNSSPVRMKRADRRKQRGGWKHGILCCKF